MIKTKVAVVDKEVEVNRYLLGNQIKELIDERGKQPQLINTVFTRNQGRHAKVGNPPFSTNKEWRKECVLNQS